MTAASLVPVAGARGRRRRPDDPEVRVGSAAAGRLPLARPRAERTALALAAVAAAACGEAPDDLPDPRGGRSGVQLSGTVSGRQVAVNDGLPDLVVEDCDIADGRDEDVCVVSEDLSGSPFVLVVENPAALAAGTALAVDGTPCGEPAACDAVVDAVVLDVQVAGGERRRRATGGEVRVTVVEPGRRYAGELRVEVPGGTFSGTFDVVPRPDRP